MSFNVNKVCFYFLSFTLISLQLSERSMVNGFNLLPPQFVLSFFNAKRTQHSRNLPEVASDSSTSQINSIIRLTFFLPSGVNRSIYTVPSR